MATATLTKPAAKGGQLPPGIAAARANVFTPADLTDDQKLIAKRRRICP